MITVKGQVSSSTPYIIDLKVLKIIINERVIDKLDHKNLNIDVNFMRGKMTTTELLCTAIFNHAFYIFARTQKHSNNRLQVLGNVDVNTVKL